MQPKNYVVGIDVGESGIGKVAVELDQDGTPIAILNSVVTIIDGGKSPDSGKSPRSRKMMGGMARRGRRLIQRRAKRIRHLNSLLTELGIVDEFGEYSDGVTYEPWAARVRLASGYVTDDIARNADLRLAILHIAHHRGWRNPWWSERKLLTEATALQAPTPEFAAIQARASVMLGVAPELLPSIGAIGAHASSPEFKLRPRKEDMTTAGTKARAAGDKIIVDKVLQLDVAQELLTLLSVQRIPDQTALKIAHMVFSSVKPTVKKDLVGKDPLNKNEYRAPRASLEFQEFKIRDAIANIRVKSSKSRLAVEQQALIVSKLNTWTELTVPSWAEVAEWIGFGEQQLTFATSDSPRAAAAPINSTYNTLANLGGTGDKSKKDAGQQIRDWFLAATPDQRSQFALFLGDSTGSSEIDLIDDFLENLDETQQSILENLERIPSGRAAYSLDTLSRLNGRLAAESQDLNEALSAEFGVVSGWKPPADSIFDHVDHPVVDQVLTDVGRWLDIVSDKYGPPMRVNVEHVRSAFFGPEALARHNIEVNANRRQRERARQEISEQLNIEQRDANPRKYIAVQMQNGQCLYCGSTITYTTAEMDHIVPRADGGSNRRENLVAVCQRCNRAKGKIPFAAWANTVDFASIDDAVHRVDTWLRPDKIDDSKTFEAPDFEQIVALAFAKLKKATKFRLQRTELDEELDERALASTAYAAREVRDRVASFLDTKFAHQLVANEATGELRSIPVEVYRGSLTAAARRASGIEGKLHLRGHDSGLRGPGKSRFDRRHHAVDAAVVAMMNPKALKVLGAREEMRAFARDGAEDTIPEWKKFSGASSNGFDSWIDQLKALGAIFNDALDADRVVVMRPLRLGANQGSLHADTINKLVAVDPVKGMTAEQVNRIVDVDVYLAVRAMADTKGALAAGVDLSAHLPAGGHIQLFDSPSAQLPVREGSVAIGGSLHHLRIFAIQKTSGKMKGQFEFKQIRVFSGEFGRIGFRAPGVNLFTHELPVWSESFRCANPALQAAILDGTARQIGWLVPGDELEFAENANITPDIPPVDGVTATPLKENRWVVSGAEDSARLNLRPAYLATEGIAKDQVPAVLTGTYFRGSLNSIISSNPTIIRRSASGTPRWRNTGDGLPISWSVSQVLGLTQD